MPDDTLYEVQSEDTREGLEWFGIETDMGYVVEATNLLMDRARYEDEASGDVSEYELGGAGDQTSSYVTISRSLWESALVTYARCFTGGKRRWMNEGIFEDQPDGVLQWHNYFKNMRDKHIAHSVSPFELGSFGVRLSGRGQDTVQFTGEGGLLHLYRGGEAAKTIEMLNWLAGFVYRSAATKRNEVGQKAVERVKQMSKEQLNNLPILEIKPEQGFDTAAKKRQ